MKRTIWQAARAAARAKRLFDVVGAIGGLAAFGPVMAVIAVAILIEDGRPILFRQERLGRGRRAFTIVKFRSMRGERVTRVGRIVRATGLDELPQFLNILRGEMSAVGPRPLTDADVRRLGWRAPRFDFRWRVRPGLTGLAQVMGAEAAGRVSDPGPLLCQAPESVARRPACGAVFCDQRPRQTPDSAVPDPARESSFCLTRQLWLLYLTNRLINLLVE